MSDIFKRFEAGDSAMLRYVLTDRRIEVCWPCRVVEDSDEIVALFIAAGTKYRAGRKRTATEKRVKPSPPVPTGERVWRTDSLRLMLPNRSHSVSLFWDDGSGGRRLSKYFVNMEEPFRRTRIGFDTQDHALDIVIKPDLSWAWRDEDELESHVREGFFTRSLAQSARREGLAVLDEIRRAIHPCLSGWSGWIPMEDWEIPVIAAGWDKTPASLWERRYWAYGVTD